MSETRAKCKDCANRTDEKPPFCTWLKAIMPVGLADDPGCEGFIPKDSKLPKAPLRTSVGKGTRAVKGDERVGGSETPVDKPKTTRPKTKQTDKSLIQTALKLKDFKGSVVMEKVLCGKPGCHCHNGALHGPYPYLHYYSNGKVRRRYLGKTVSALLSHSKEELEKMLHEIEAVLGQEGKDSHG